MNWSVFDIIGPIMIGPSSSHTSGAARLGYVSYLIAGSVPQTALIELHGSFSKVYKGHGTDKAIVAGLLGYKSDDERLVNSFNEADKAGLRFQIVPTDLGENNHPNTVRLTLTTNDNSTYTIKGSSIGGGSIILTEINGIEVDKLDFRHPTAIVYCTNSENTIRAMTSLQRKLSIKAKYMPDHKTCIITFDDCSAEKFESIKGELSCQQGIIWLRHIPALL